MAQMMKGGATVKMGGASQPQQPTQILQKPQAVGMSVAPAAGMPGTILIPEGHMITTAPQPQLAVSAHMAAGMPIETHTVFIPGGMATINGNSAAMATEQQADAANGASNLANTKEKTPMCLVNELARYNKIQHQYTLTDEQGPAHKKTFYVKLKLGEEEYAASGPSIKKAQHAAAGIALEKTQHRHPPLKTTSHSNSNINATITPTVELNALAMKRGEPAIYRPIEYPNRPGGFYPAQPNYDFRGMYNQRYHYPRMPRIFYVSLKVGQREFIGQGPTRQAARHSAAAKALKVMQALPLPDRNRSLSSSQAEKKSETEANNSTSTDSGDGAKDAAVETSPAEEQHDSNDESGDDSNKDDLKSEISLVHEIALKRNLGVSFEVVRESGPPHMRTFVTRCTVGDFVTDGEGNGKKISKKHAAEAMLEKLKELPTLPPAIARPKRLPNNKKKNRNLIKIQKADPSYGVGINPISRLIQIQQAKKEKEPIYTLVSERGMPRRREFLMQVQVGDHKCTGVGPNKKLAKRSAAESMLQLLGYSRPSPQPAKPAIKSGDAQPSNEKKVTFMDPSEMTNVTRQVVPGVLLMPDRTQAVNPSYLASQAAGANKPPTIGLNNSNYSHQTTATIAKELLDTGVSPTAEGLNKSDPNPAVQVGVVRPEQQLKYLGKLLGFEVQFTDFPKRNNTEYLSLVSLATSPPHVSHGSGPSLEASHDMAALTALRAIAERGIDSVATNSSSADKDNNMAAGDGPHIKKEPSDKILQATPNERGAVKTEAK